MINLYKKFVEEKYDQNGVIESLKINVPEEFNFAYDIVDVLAKAEPQRRAMLWCNDKGEEKTFTFGDMSEYSNRTANYFKSLGINKGDKVVLILKRHYQFWFSILALHKIGAIAIPATNQLTKKDLIYRFNKANVKAIICTADGEISDHVETALPESPSVAIKIIVNGKKSGWNCFDEDIIRFSDSFERPTGELATKNDDIMLMYFTSGTSGNPKCACMNYTYPLGHIVTARFWHNVYPDGLHLTVAETGWAKSVWGKLYGQWICEAGIFVYDHDRFEAHNLLKMIEKHKVTTFCAPPTIYRFLIKADLSEYDLSSLRYATTAGEAVNPEVYNKFLSLTGLRLMEAYGQTELIVTVGNFVGMTPKPGSMGKPSPALNVDVVDDNLNSVAPGVVGEIVVRTDVKPVGIFAGYYEDEEKTKEAWNNNVYHTGDMAWKDEDGYLWYVSRKDDLIKSSGYRISPFEIESVLMEHSAVLECAVTAVSDPLRGQAVKATIVLTKQYKPTEELKKELQDYVKHTTAPYKYPRVIEFVTELPKTISGKIKRVDIRNNDKK